jgi:hypothetical protein
VHADEEEDSHNREEDHRIQQACPAEEGDVEGGDVEDHGSDQNNTQATEAREEERNTSEHFNGFNHRQETRAKHRTEECSSWGARRRLRHRDELQPEVESEDDKDEA